MQLVCLSDVTHHLYTEVRNGIILTISYKFFANEPNELFVSTSSVIITGLEEFTYYNFSMGAATVNGTGPFTSVVKGN